MQLLINFEEVHIDVFSHSIDHYVVTDQNRNVILEVATDSGVRRVIVIAAMQDIPKTMFQPNMIDRELLDMFDIVMGMRPMRRLEKLCRRPQAPPRMLHSELNRTKADVLREMNLFYLFLFVQYIFPLPFQIAVIVQEIVHFNWLQKSIRRRPYSINTRRKSIWKCHATMLMTILSNALSEKHK